MTTTPSLFYIPLGRILVLLDEILKIQFFNKEKGKLSHISNKEKGKLPYISHKERGKLPYVSNKEKGNLPYISNDVIFKTVLG